MKLSDSITKAAEVQKNARGPKNQRHWQKVSPPANPVAEPLRPPGAGGGFSGSAAGAYGGAGGGSVAPVPVLPVFGLPQRPLPPISIGVDSVKQFEGAAGIPKRRLFTPTPL